MHHLGGVVLLAATLVVERPLLGQVCQNAEVGPPGPLTFRDAVQMALDHNPQLAAARAEVRRIEAEAVQPLEGVLPTVKLQEQWLRSDDPSTVLGLKMKQGAFSPADFSSAGFMEPPPFSTFGGQVALQVPLLNADAWLGRGQGRTGARAARLGLDRREQILSFAVLRAYFAVPLSAERLAAVRDAEEVAARAVAQAEALERQRLVAPVDVLQARSRLAAMHAELAGALADSAEGMAALEQLLGGPLGQGFAAEPLPDSLTVPGLDQALAGLRQRPDMGAREEAVSAARLGVRRAESAWLPRFNGFGTLDLYDSRLLGTHRTYLTMGVVASWNLFDGLHQVAQRRAAGAASDRAVAERDGALLEARTELLTAQAKHEAARLARVHAQEAYDLARQARAIAETRYRNALSSMTDLLAAQAAETGASARLSAARYEYVVTAGAYRLAAGMGVMEE